MVVRIARLKRRAEFLRVAAARRKRATPGLILQAAESQAAKAVEGGFRVGFTASRRVGKAVARNAKAVEGGFRVGFTASRRVGKAVARNRARRRLRAAVDKVMPSRAQPGHDYVVIARRETLDRPFAELVGDLESALDRVAAPPAGGDRGRAKRTAP